MSLRKDLPQAPGAPAAFHPGLIRAATYGADAPRAVAEALDAVGAQVKEHRAAIDVRMNEVQANLQHMQQAMAKISTEGVGSGAQAAGPRMALAPLLEESDGFAALKNKNTPSCRIALPPGFLRAEALTSGSSAAGGTSPVDRRPGILVANQRRLTIRDLLPVVPTESGMVEYVREKLATFAAAPVAEGDYKPETTIELELVQARAITIAHWSSASVQILADIPQLENYLDTRLRFGLQLAEERQLLMGSGTGENLNGLYTQAVAYAAPFPYANPTMIDRLRLAMAQLEDNDYLATGFVMHPDDWARIELLKTTDAEYLISNPSENNARVLWGVPVVTTGTMTIDKFLVGDFRSAGFIIDRQTPTLDIATQDGTDFVRNLVKLRLEERIGLAVQQRYALIKGDLGNVDNGDGL